MGTGAPRQTPDQGTSGRRYTVREGDLDLRAEVEHLRAENARLRAQIAEYFAEPATHPVEREE